MATKFSDFTAQAATGTTFVVGYDGTTNTQYSQDNLTNFVFNGTIANATTTLTTTGTSNIIFSLSGNSRFYINSLYILPTGRITTPSAGGLSIISFGTSLIGGNLTLYNGTHLTGSNNTGYLTVSGTANTSDITARLGIIGKHNDATSHALRVQNSDGEDMFSVRNDKYTIVNINNGIENGFLLKNEATYTMLDAGDDGGATPNSAQMRMYDNNNVRFYFKASQGLMVADTGNNGPSGASSVLTATSNTRGFLPPRNADPASNITTPVAGLMAYDTTDNELQFYNGTSWNSAGGGASIYTADGTLSGNRNVNLGTNNLGFTNGQVGIGTSSPLYTLDTKGTVANNWLARVQNESGTGYGLQVKVDSNSSGKVTFATKNSLGYTMTVHNNGNVAIGKNSLTGPSARLHIKGSGLTNATTALLVEDSSGNDIIKALDDRTVRLGYNANQITTESNNGGTVKLNNVGGAPLFSAGVIAGSTAKINVYGGYYNTFEYGASKGLVFTNEAGFNVAQDNSSMLTCVSSTKGFLPPRMTTTQRDAINSGTFTTGLTLYNTTDNKLQFYNGSAWTDAGGGGDNIYTADGTLSGNRTVTMGSNSLSFNSTQITSGGEISIPSGGRFIVNSFSTELRRNFLKLYSGAGPCLTGTLAGFCTISSFGSGDPSATYDINARLGVVGKSSTSTTSYAFRVQDSAAADMLTVRDDGAITLGKGATLFDEDGNGAQDVVIGYGASTDYASTYYSNQRRVAIGYNADVNAGGGIAIGQDATVGSTESVAIGYSAETTAYRATAIGYNTSASTSGIAIGYNASTTGPNSIAIGGTQSATTGYGVHVGVGGSAGIASVSVGAGSVSGTNGTSIGRNASSTGIGAFTAGASMASSGDYSFAFGGFTYGSSGATNTDSNSVKFYMNTTTPQLNFHLDNNSWWDSSGNFGFGDGNTSPTATVDINGTFRLRSATNVNGKVLTADANGNGTWSDSINVNGQVKGGYESGVTTLAFDWDNGNIQKSSATGAQTFSGANAIAGSTYIIMIGTPTVTWGSSVKWPGATAPTLAGTTNIITLLYDGTSYYATSVLNYS